MKDKFKRGGQRHATRTKLSWVVYAFKELKLFEAQ